MRRDPRFNVRLNVKFETAMDFITEYAENLSRGGMFVRGAHQLDPRQQVTVEIELPGAGTFQVVAEVAHVITAEQAKAMNRKPGAGLAIVRSSKGFRPALREYLFRLGRRKDRLVLASDPLLRQRLEECGYSTDDLPLPAELPALLLEGEQPVLAVLVTRADESAYRASLSRLDRGGMVFGIDFMEELDEILPRLDALL
jgi:uncharacterized protein (TIGR02266 family)